VFAMARRRPVSRRTSFKDDGRTFALIASSSRLNNESYGFRKRCRASLVRHTCSEVS
jgi:hypothetical protein